MTGIKEMEDKYDTHMKRYIEELEHEDRLLGELLRCREQQGQRGWQIATTLFQLKELRDKEAL